MKKFLKNKSKNQNQENTTRKIKQNDTVNKKEQTYIIKNSSDEYKENKIEYKENKRDKSKDNVHKIKNDKTTEKTKSIELNFGFIILKIIVIALLALLITTLTAKTVMTKIETKEHASLSAEEVTDSEIVDVEENATIIISEWNDDSLTASISYDSGEYLHVIDGDSLEQIGVYSSNGETLYLDDYKVTKEGYNTTLYFFSYIKFGGFTDFSIEVASVDDLGWDYFYDTWYGYIDSRRLFSGFERGSVVTHLSPV